MILSKRVTASGCKTSRVLPFAGIRVFISFDELLPTAEKYGEHHIAVYGVSGGMVVMALSLLLFA